MKRDINLLPDKKGGPRKNTGIVIAVVVTLVYVLVFGLAILIPKSIKDEATELSNQLDNQITELQPQVDEYDRVKTQLDVLRTSIDSTTSLNFSKFDAVDALEIIQSTCPSGVMIERITNSATQIGFDCIARNNYQIAQFALELERSGEFTSVSISGSSPYDMTLGANNEIEEGNTVRTTFVVTYDLSVQEETDEEGGDGNEN